MRLIERPSQTALTALFPVRNDALRELTDVLRRDEHGVFDGCPRLHLGRLELIRDLRGELGAASRDRLECVHLLLALDCDGAAGDVLDWLHEHRRTALDAVLGRCFGYPEGMDAVYLRRFVARATVATQLSYRAFDATVDEIGAALALQRRTAALIEANQGAGDAERRVNWRRYMGTRV